MTEQERKFRLDAVQAAIDNNLLEGLYLVSKHLISLMLGLRIKLALMK
ncbi:hypothetical protein NYR79_10705 [Actinobacillus equuli subsp. haemolyticus]|nr:hypothetical protein [Actinobacillus equuli]WGE71296.1 hypothetical protein NYR79_10705 [Actinobacillus equuli subsp. haemolyticus]